MKTENLTRHKKVAIDFLRKCEQVLGQPEWFFLAFGALFVLIFIIILPPFQGLDEPTHFYRIVQIGERHILPRHIATTNGVERFGDLFPLSLINEVDQLTAGTNPVTEKYNTALTRKYLTKPVTKPTVGQIEGFEGSEIYSPVAYIPQVIGYKASRIITASPLLRTYFIRLADAVTWLALIWFAIRLIPVGKWTMAVLALLPSSVTAAGTMQVDPLLLGLCFLFVAYVLHLRAQKKLLSNLQMLGLGALMLGIALSKPGYYPLLLLILLVPKKLFKYFYPAIGLLLGIPLILSAAWSYAVRGVTVVILRTTTPAITYTPADQAHNLIHHPLSFLTALFNSNFTGQFDIMLRQLLGTFSWSAIELPLLFQFLSLFLILFALMYQAGRSPTFVLSKFQKLLTALILLACYTLIFLTFYILLNPPGAISIEGVQGRYFLPMLALLIPVFYGRRKLLTISERAFVRIVQIGTGLVLLSTVLSFVGHFY